MAVKAYQRGGGRSTSLIPWRAHSLMWLAGFARNLGDGSVEVLAEGPDEALAAFEARLKQGPAFAKVAGVERTNAPERGDEGFHIR